MGQLVSYGALGAVTLLSNDTAITRTVSCVVAVPQGKDKYLLELILVLVLRDIC